MGEKGSRSDRDSSFAHTVLSLSYRRQGRYEDAIAELEKGITTPSAQAELYGRESVALTELGVCYVVAGKRAEARATLKEIKGETRQR